MATKDATGNAAAGQNVAYQPNSPYEVRMNTVDFSQFSVAASGADTVNAIPIGVGDVVIAAWYRTDVPSVASSTMLVNCPAGALVAATPADAAAGTKVKGAGAGLNANNATAGYVSLTTGAAVTVTFGKATVYTVVQKAW